MRALKQDAKEKRYGRICLLLGIILLGTVGCSHTVSDTPSIDAEIAEFLQVSESQAESLWEGIQTIDQNSRAEKTTVHVRQAFGNEREMYVLYDVTFSTEIDLQKEENNGILPTTVTLSGVGEVSKAGKGGSVYTIGINGQTITYLSYFESNLDQYPEGDLLLDANNSWNHSARGYCHEGRKDHWQRIRVSLFSEVCSRFLVPDRVCGLFTVDYDY